MKILLAKIMFEHELSVRQVSVLTGVPTSTIENKCSKNIDFIIYMVYILCKGISNNCSATERRCVHMKKVSKDFVIEWVQRIPDEDEKFLRQLYTIIKKHLERTGKH